MEVSAGYDDIPETTKELLWGMFWAEKEEPNYVIVDYPEIYNQWTDRDPSTKYACWACASIWVSNSMNYDEGSDVYTDWIEARYEQLEDWDADVSQWSTMMSWIDYHLEKDLISWWYIVGTPEEAHTAMCKGHYIWSGSNNINWTETRKPPYDAVYGWGSGHFVRLEYSNKPDRGFTWANSYWLDSYDDGSFYTDWDDFDQLFTCVAFVDKEDLTTAEQIEKKLEKFIKDNWHSATRQIITKRRTDLTLAEKLILWNKLMSM